MSKHPTRGVYRAVVPSVLTMTNQTVRQNMANTTVAVSIGRTISTALDLAGIPEHDKAGNRLSFGTWEGFTAMLRGIAEEAAEECGGSVHFIGRGECPATSEETFTVIFDCGEVAECEAQVAYAAHLFYQDCAAFSTLQTTFPGPRPW